MQLKGNAYKLFVYMCTHPETNSLGVLKTTIDKLADELNVSYENVFQNLKKMKRLKIILKQIEGKTDSFS